MVTPLCLWGHDEPPEVPGGTLLERISGVSGDSGGSLDRYDRFPKFGRTPSRFPRRERYS